MSENSWIQTNLPTDLEPKLGFWVLSCENTLIRNFFIEDNKCYVCNENGDYEQHPFPDYWKYFYDEPDWMSKDE